MMDGKDSDDVGAFRRQATSIESDEAKGTDEERLQRALAMSMMDGMTTMKLDLSRLRQSNRMRV